jgi:hypothetical protein
MNIEDVTGDNLISTTDDTIYLADHELLSTSNNVL